MQNEYTEDVKKLAWEARLAWFFPRPCHSDGDWRIVGETLEWRELTGRPGFDQLRGGRLAWLHMHLDPGQARHAYVVHGDQSDRVVTGL